MKITVPLENGYLGDKYTKHASNQFKNQGFPICSFPIQLANVPSNAQSLAITLLDDDAILVCGFTYIHWVAANIDPNVTVIPENASQTQTIKMTLGNNSLPGRLINVVEPELAKHYVGPTPPDKTHQYQLTVYALDTTLNLQDGFWLNEFKQQIKNHILDQTEQKLPVRA
ncbi:YbhB/YbcL family Raf kinase inhibitor-like protein [Fructilactobacillus vespulae]|uniref:YbhB/YbcL family Raf kinase inhibitor-like protein n=1 Tax=Fructilactobacillus vespulae TaxID=1249630 RepID=UPI0039B6D8C6